MTELLEDVLATGVVRDSEGTAHVLHSNTSREQCDFLQKLVREAGASRCLEIGLAYGISTLAICDAIAGSDGASLVSIDPFQKAHWQNIGLLNIDRAGFGGLVEFHSAPSHKVLPALLAEEREIDFAYVDTSKIFDVVLVDAFYITRLLRTGGIVVFDDCLWPGIRRLVRYLATWPHLTVHATHGTASRMHPVRSLATRLARAMPLRHKLLHPDLVVRDAALGIDAGCVAFRKTGDDTRPWSWAGQP